MNVSSEQVQSWAKLVVQSWDDAALKQRLLSDPIPALREAGFQLPAGMRVKVVEDPARTAEFADDVTLVLRLPPAPSEPRGAALSEAELDAVSGGTVRMALASNPHAAYLAGTIMPTHVPDRFPDIAAP